MKKYIFKNLYFLKNCEKTPLFSKKPLNFPLWSVLQQPDNVLHLLVKNTFFRTLPRWPGPPLALGRRSTILQISAQSGPFHLFRHFTANNVHCGRDLSASGLQIRLGKLSHQVADYLAGRIFYAYWWFFLLLGS